MTGPFGALGSIGIWTAALHLQPWPLARQAALRLEQLGYRALWIPEASWREPFAFSAMLLSATSELAVATGIANIHARDAVAMAAGHKTLAEAFPGRFVLGLGVGHRELVEGVRGHRYESPVKTMRSYMERMSQAPYDSPEPSAERITVLAALGPKMLALARAHASGVHPYNVTPDHTYRARSLLGPEPLLAPEQAVLLVDDPSRARELARRHRIGNILRQPNYMNNLRRLGFRDEDFAGRGSNRLVDAIVAWGTVETVVGRVHEHLAAGADHVSLQVISEDPGDLPMSEWTVLAEALGVSGSPARRS